MQFFVLATCLAAALAAPVVKRSTISAKNLVSIAPATASCSDAFSPDECRTASTAAANLAGSFYMFGITDFNTQAALVALTLYESDNYKYSSNKVPGVPGQGTRNMQSPAYNLKYARFLSGLESSGVTAADVQTAQSQGPSAVLALVNTDLWSFSSAAWFLTTQCSQTVREGLAQGTQAGWSAYLTQCIGTTATNDRTQVWDQVKSLGQW